MPDGDGHTGVEIADLLDSPEFLGRPITGRSGDRALALVQRLTRLLVDDPAAVLHELVEAAQTICHADSAGITLERYAADGTPMFYWAAITGTYAPFAERVLPQASFPCRIALEEQRPQQIRLSTKFFADRGIDALPVTDGILVPWKSSEQRATLWVLAHERTQAFHLEDYRLLEVMSDLASVAYRNLQMQENVARKASAIASNAMAHTLAHRINNPLQSITNSIFLALHSLDEAERVAHVEQASSDLRSLSELVGQLLLLHRPVLPVTVGASAR